MLITKKKDPSAVLDYKLDWSAYLAGDTITASTWTVSPAGVVKGFDSFTDNTTTVWLSAGVAGKKYVVTNRIITAGGRTEERSFTLDVLEQ